MSGHVKVANPKERRRQRRKAHIRLTLKGTPERPRLSVFRSARYVYVQAVDDLNNKVLASASDQAGPAKGELAGKHKKERAREVGKAIGQKLLGLNITSVVFDRNGYIYHGRVKEVADGARESGLQF
jgi:large subunit ribosomal protein L18